MCLQSSELEEIGLASALVSFIASFTVPFNIPALFSDSNFVFRWCQALHRVSGSPLHIA